MVTAGGDGEDADAVQIGEVEVVDLNLADAGERFREAGPDENVGAGAGEGLVVSRPIPE